MSDDMGLRPLTPTSELEKMVTEEWVPLTLDQLGMKSQLIVVVKRNLPRK
jgi:hypothetical protein